MKIVANGFSSTGTPHALEIEEYEYDEHNKLITYKATLLGNKGKRHASVILVPEDIDALIKFLQKSRRQK
jgi:hypothetical protein